MNQINLFNNPNIKNIHFIGIGGISMSGLAEILLRQGYKISGSDIKSSLLTQKLQKLGVDFSLGHSPLNIKNPDLVVYTSAIANDNDEYLKAQSLSIPVIDRATLLGEIMSTFPCNIAISGTHGKTTTTSMIATVMLDSGEDPTIHIGGELDIIGGSTKIGDGDCFIIEACEYMESFLKFKPFIAVILNIEEDHLDYFRDIEHIQTAFLKFAELIPANGHLVACVDDNNVCMLLDKIQCNRHTFGIENKVAQWQARNISFDESGCASFDVYSNSNFYGNFNLSVPGTHSIYNALATIVTCAITGVKKHHIKKSLSLFLGPNRRFECKGTKNGIKVIDDYAHHPSEIKTTLSSIKNANHSSIWCVFQPHTYTRTLALLDDFASCFKSAEHVVITDIYAAREKDTGKIHSRALVDKVLQTGKDCIYIKTFHEIVDYLSKNVKPNDVVLTMGAGDIYRVGEMFLAK